MAEQKIDHPTLISGAIGMTYDNQANVRMVRPMDRSVLGPEEAHPLPLPITDDRNSDPLYSARLCVGGCGAFYDACECVGMVGFACPFIGCKARFQNASSQEPSK